MQKGASLIVKHNYMQRINKLREQLAIHRLDALLVVSPANCLYLSGFRGSKGYLLISEQRSFLLTDFRYLEQAGIQAPHMEIVELEKHFSETTAALIKSEGWSNLGVEGEHITYKDYRWLKERAGVPLEAHQQMVEQIRAVKDAAEIRIIREAARVTDEAFDEISPLIRPGIREKDLALELEYILRKKGGEGPAFDFIVASGYRSAWPHGIASAKKLAGDEPVTIDFGVKLDGYVSDMSRTVYLGAPQKKHEEIWNVLLEAQQAAIKGVHEGVKGLEVDLLAREVITQAGYGKNFGHGLGHGLGLEPHELPTLSVKGKETLVPGMVITVEPGIYISDWGGARIEDMVLVTEEGAEILTHSPRNLVL